MHIIQTNMIWQGVCVRQCSKSLRRWYRSVFLLEEPTQIVKSIENVYQDVYEKREVYSRLWRIQTEEIHLYEDMSVYLSEQFLKAYVQEENVEKAEYVAEIYSAIIMTSIKWCITHGVESMQEMISFFSPKLLSAFQTFLV